MITCFPNKLTEDQRENAIKWIAALISGEYKQTTGGLYNIVEDSYCCLGVKCKVDDLKFDVGVRAGGKFCSPWLVAHCQPTLKLDRHFAVNKVGLKDGVGSLAIDNVLVDRLSLAELNDGGFTFLMLADIIQYSLDNN